MHIIRLKISDKVFDKLVWLLGKFSNDEVEIIDEDTEFFENQKYLKGELDEIINGQARFIGIDEAESSVENIIKRREGSL